MIKCKLIWTDVKIVKLEGKVHGVSGTLKLEGTLIYGTMFTTKVAA